MTIHLYQGDIPGNIKWGKAVAIDTEATGLNFMSNRLCLAQLSSGDGHAHLVKFAGEKFSAPNLKKLLTDQSVQKIFHFARFDVGLFKKTFDVMTTNIYCTKMASKLARTYTDRHSLKDLCSELLSLELPKQHASTDWAVETLSKDQKNYAANDVLHLHKLRDKLNMMLEREDRMHLAQAIFDFLPTRVELDLLGWGDHDFFAHGAT